MFDGLLEHLPDGAELTILGMKPNGDALVHVKTDHWQLGYEGSDPDELLARIWAEQSTYEAQQAIKQHNEAYKLQLRVLSVSNTAAVKQLSDEHAAKKAAAIDKAKAAFKATKEKKA